MQQKDEGVRELFFEQFNELKIVLAYNIQEELIWEKKAFNQNNQAISGLFSDLNNVSIYNEKDWPSIFLFFEKRMIGLHTFWVEFEEIFKDLEK
jgi:hypothetical protein